MDGDHKNVKKSKSKTRASVSVDTDTSILHFKSPKIKPIEEVKLFSFESTKSKKRLNLDNFIDNKPGTSKQVEKHITNNDHMQTVSNMSCDQEDSPTNLSNNTKIAYVCPLCFKNHKDNNSRIFHMKSCATKNKISMKKLLEAMKLQERQTAERISLGLPGAPILQNKKQGSIRRMATNQDSQLQLALALSKSLYEVEQNKNSNQTEQDSIVRNTKNSVENITSRIQKKKQQNNRSILQIRSQEERDRLLTEKIAEILIDSETLIQRQQQAKNGNESKNKDNLKSRFLKRFLNYDNQLWNAAMLQSSQTDFFVKDLLPYIVPSDKKQTFMENKNASIIMEKSPQEDKMAVTHDSYLHIEGSLNTSYRIDAKLFTDVRKENIKQSCINNLIVDWGNTLNDSSSSDVIIFVNGDRQIWAHKLVFHVRCPNILLDINPNENPAFAVREKICWTDVEFHIALAFLEFIYCGIIEKYSILSNNSVAISSLGYLARRYKVKELFPYLRHLYVISHTSTSMDNEFETNEQSIYEINSNDEQNKLTITEGEDNKVVKCGNQDTLDIITMEVSHNQLLKTNMSSPEKYTIPHTLIDRENSVSPDIFDDIDNITLNHSGNTEFTHIKNPKSNIEYDLSSPNQHNLKSIATNQLLSPSFTNENKKSTEECMLLKSIIVTPRINQTEQVSDTMADKVKLKSDLTLFIEEVQKENAISDSEIDFENGFSPKLFTQNKRNPFRKAEYTDSSIILDRLDNSKHSLSKAGKKVSRLSKLESDMQTYAIENPQLCNITVDENFKFTTPADHNCTDLRLSMKEVNTSIACNNKTLETIKQSVKENNVSMTTAYCSSSETETDDENISMYTKYKRKHINNSIAIYRSAVKKAKNNITEIEIDKRGKDSYFSKITECAYSDTDHTRNDDLNVSSLSNMNMDENFSLDFSRKSRSDTEICNALKDTFQYTKSFKIPELDNLNGDKSITLCDSNSSKTLIIHNKSFNDDCSSMKLPKLPEIEKLHNSPLKSHRYSNPILISSSPEIDLTSADSHDFSKYDNDHIVSLKTQEFDNDLQDFFSNTQSFSNVNIKNKIGSIASENSILPARRENKKLRKRSRSEGSLRHNYIIEKDCEIDSTPPQQCSKRDSYKSNTPNSLLTITESHNISPNYDIMDTPELHREMKKYGLKTQSRKKAIKLLTYIYNELHPTISSYEIAGANFDINNVEEEPPKKRQKSQTHLSDKCSMNKYEYNMSSPTIVDTKDYSKRRKTLAVDNTNIEHVIALNDCSNIADAFSKLLKFNKDIHNSILRYEPLNIKLIHRMLKAGGFKCNEKILMDFLDEQCITFHSPENKLKMRTKKIHRRLK